MVTFGGLLNFPLTKEIQKTMKHDKRLQGVGSAIRNIYNDRVITHPHKKQWNKNCLICQRPVYHDGQIYWSLCLSHLQEKSLGPFRMRLGAVDYDD